MVSPRWGKNTLPGLVTRTSRPAASTTSACCDRAIAADRSPSGPAPRGRYSPAPQVDRPLVDDLGCRRRGLRAGTSSDGVDHPHPLVQRHGGVDVGGQERDPRRRRPPDGPRRGRTSRARRTRTSSVPPTTVGSPWSMRLGLEPDVGDRPPRADGDRRAPQVQGVLERRGVGPVLGVHQAVGPRLDLGRPPVAGRRCPSRRRTRRRRRWPSRAASSTVMACSTRSALRGLARLAHEVALVAHHPAHREPAGAGQVGEPPGVGGVAAAPGHAHVDVDRAPRAPRRRPRPRSSPPSRPPP